MILDNPFHVIGLPADATTRERTKRESYIARYLEVGRPLEFGSEDIYFPGCRRNKTTVQRALRQLQDGPTRLKYGLWWFTRGTNPNGAAFSSLGAGDQREALAALDAGYVSSVSNVGTLCLLIGLKPEPDWSLSEEERAEYVLRGLRAKARLMMGHDADAVRPGYIGRFGDDISARNVDRILQGFEASVLEFLVEAEKYGVEVPTGQLMRTLRAYGRQPSVLARGLAAERREDIERAIKHCEWGTEQGEILAGVSGDSLVETARPLLDELQELGDHYNHTVLGDQVATTVLNAAATYYRDCYLPEDNPWLEKVMLKRVERLEQAALELASDGEIIGRASRALTATRNIQEALERLTELGV